ncbi:MAG: response regulator, partial [Oscillospiraceae bacterium]|nr:response regulator [Oscillospiraceae bacterium]
MYKAIIVDDEKIIREWLSVKVQWQELGFEVVGAFRNGKEALAFVTSNPIDLVISDIKMPVMDGIEFVRTLRRQGYDKKIILISGFDDFSYAKTAIQNGVSDYILKPVEMGEITNSVKNVKSQLDSEQTLHKNTLEQNSYMLAEYIKLAEAGKLDLDKSHNALSLLIDGQKYCFVRISPDSDDEQIGATKQSFLQNSYIYQECMIKLKSDYAICEVFTPQDIIFICMVDNQNKKQMTQQLVKLLTENDLQASVGISATHDNVRDFVIALSEANKVKPFKFFNGTKVVFDFNDDDFEIQQELFAVNDLILFEKEIKDLILKGDMT